MTGRFVPPIHRKSLYSLQYSMLPAKRVGVVELWGMLRQERDEEAGYGGEKEKERESKGAKDVGGRKRGERDREKDKGGMWWSK